tara:strand:+ start:20524 stop:20745 length:222 start_codon:yes stop_codon:yes gene_type:complete
MTYLTENQIDLMAEEAATNYEVSADWNNALVAIVEYAADEYGVKATKGQALTALKRAKSIWQGAIQAVQKELA